MIGHDTHSPIVLIAACEYDCSNSAITPCATLRLCIPSTIGVAHRWNSAPLAARIAIAAMSQVAALAREGSVDTVRRSILKTRLFWSTLMKRLVFSFVALVSLAAPMAIRAQQPPIIDRNLFFGEIEIAGAQISPDGQYLSFLKPYKGTRNIWVKKASEPFTAARPVSAEATRPVQIGRASCRERV